MFFFFLAFFTSKTPWEFCRQTGPIKTSCKIYILVTKNRLVIRLFEGQCAAPQVYRPEYQHTAKCVAPAPASLSLQTYKCSGGDQLLSDHREHGIDTVGLRGRFTLLQSHSQLLCKSERQKISVLATQFCRKLRKLKTNKSVERNFAGNYFSEYTSTRSYLKLTPSLSRQALFASGILTAPSPLPDKPQAAAGGYGAPATPSCTLQRVEQPSGYGCTQDQECSTSYEQECSTSYEQQCENVYEEKCETKERLQPIKYLQWPCRYR